VNYKAKQVMLAVIFMLVIFGLAMIDILLYRQVV
jgi:hypothetical protein